MKKYILIILVLILIFVVFLLKLNNDNSEKQEAVVLGDDIRLISYENGNAALGINFLKTKTDRSKLSLVIDSNNNGIFEDTEWLVKDILVLAKENKRNKVYFKAPDNFTGEQNILITLNDEIINKNVSVIINDLSDLMGLDTITNPEESMKGFSINHAFAEDNIIEIVQEDVPDITQKRGECAPTAAANGLISLINNKGRDEDKISDPSELIEELKKDMKWNKENGVSPDNFVIGKNLWAARHGLPIRTTKVGDTHGIGTIDPIRDALANGASIELRIKFANADGSSAGGHMVTVIGIHQGEGQTYLDINDPYTAAEEGSETIEIRSNKIINYGPWKSITVVSWGFTQIWETPLGSDTALEPMTDTEIEGLLGEFDGQEAQTTIQTSFTHVKPGEYSEIYAAVTTIPGTEISLTLDGPGVSGQKRQIIAAGDDGQAYFKWKITAYGTYTINGSNLSSTVTVN